MKVSSGKKYLFQSGHLSIKSSIVVILFSLFLCFFPILVVIKTIQSRVEGRAENEMYELKAIVQTGPRKRALPSQYLLQQMGLSSDLKKNIYGLNLEHLQNRLNVHPAILDAVVDIIPPDTLYVDYTVRDPKLVLGNWENTAIDTQMSCFPLYPYYTPKKLPRVYLSDTREIKWGDTSHSPELKLSLEIIKDWEEPLYTRGIAINHVDVSHAFTPSLGDKEVVFQLEKVATGAKFYVRTLSHDPIYLQHFISYYDANENAFDTIDIVDMRLKNTAYIKYK